jgi:hypothetical protein
VNKYTMSKNHETVNFADAEKFLAAVEAFLRFGELPRITIPKGAISVWRRLQEVFTRNNIELVVTVDSDPEAIDWVLNGLAGGVIGAPCGMAVGGGVLAILARFGYVIPHVGWLISLASVAGLAIGATAGLYVTHMGLRVTFSQAVRDAIDLQGVALA